VVLGVRAKHVTKVLVAMVLGVRAEHVAEELVIPISIRPPLTGHHEHKREYEHAVVDSGWPKAGRRLAEGWPKARSISYMHA